MLKILACTDVLGTRYMLSRFHFKFQSFIRNFIPLRLLDIYANDNQKPIGYVLVSYLPEPILWRENDKRFLGHSNLWEAAEIVRICNKLGYIVDVISWDDYKFIPKREYTAIIDIHMNLNRYSDRTTNKILYITGSYPSFLNLVEHERLENLKQRRSCILKPRRSLSQEVIDIFDDSLESANYLILLGNEITRNTFPERVRDRIKTISPTGSYLNRIIVKKAALKSREFLWYNGRGAVHKGLDLVLEVFARHPEYVLHVVGPYQKERDFVKAYRFELTKCSNIKSHNYLLPSSKKFQKISENVIAFISPSASEGMSTSAITCMQYGMIPVISKNCGISLEKGMGYVLNECSCDEIERAVYDLMNIRDNEVISMMKISQDFALKSFSRNEYTRQIEQVLRKALKNDL